MPPRFSHRSLKESTLKKTILVVAWLCLAMPLFAGEGMWMPQQVPQLAPELQKLGLKMDPQRFADLSAGSMYDLLEHSGVHLSRVTEEVHPVSLRAEEADAFGLPAGAPAFAVERLAYSGERPIEHRLVLAPGDRVTLTASWGNLG